jgi:Ankyrin repeat
MIYIRSIMKGGGVDQVRMLSSKPSLKRSLDDDESSNSASAITAATTLDLPNASTSPADYMRSLSRKRPRHYEQPPPQPSQPLPNHATMTAFHKVTITDEQLEGYTMETVTAVRTNDIERLRSILSQNQPRRNVLSRACNRNGESLLHLACRRSSLDTIGFLVQEAQVDVTMVDDLGRTCLHDVCWRPNVEEALEIASFLVQEVPQQLTTSILHRTDLRGHCCWDYVRREHWTVWHAFMHQHSSLFKHGDKSDTLSDPDEVSEKPPVLRSSGTLSCIHGPKRLTHSCTHCTKAP